MRKHKWIYPVAGFVAGVITDVWIFFPYDLMCNSVDAAFLRIISMAIVVVCTAIGCGISAGENP